MDYVSGNN